ncbi:STM4504/CBY_0614 family protein [Corallococcus aberystwythensis]|uniref:Abortive infection protein-like C-terminal domain-containing protein n=1 Tax=Corallococcus aberystwythensis TaxID=2316722 RepID=A0A3A8Q0K2_9BACT|nr:hypothetical protein [Corallococcus aberystwythensis]RKH62286.1 hypothetical protein D7W81_22520 [Corallococcus aberystwythensis]
MANIDIYSKRKKRQEGSAPDVFVYDKVPEALRIQIVHMWQDIFRDHVRGGTFAYDCYKAVHDILCREYGVFYLSNDIAGMMDDYGTRCRKFILSCDPDRVLDIVELTFKVARLKIGDRDTPGHLSVRFMDETIAELNSRFREHGVGYQFESDAIMRVDSSLLHAEVVRPALRLLMEEEFQGAEEEFRSAHEHYRHGKYKEALVESLKAFESTMKTVCGRKSWVVAENATARVLIGALFDHGLVPAPMAAHFSALRTTLEAGVPTLRNRLGGHGQGEEPVEVPDYLAAYVLHLTAANIVMVVEAFKAMK